jgi:general secretion pathway protein A
MYTWFYDFSEEPFQSNPDPKFLFLTDSHREVLNSIQLGIVERKGIVLVTGEPGIGKTLLMRQLVRTLDPSIKTIIIYRPPNLLEEVLEQMLLSLGVSIGERSRESLLQQMRTYVYRNLYRGETLALMIDEAHILSPEVLKEIVRLACPRAKRDDLFTLVLLGRPELENTLNREDFQEFREKIWIRRRLRPFQEEEARKYIEHRLTLAGSSLGKIFTPQAVFLICRYGKGNPRTLNILCDNSLLVGYGLTKKPVDKDIVKEVLEDLDLMTMGSSSRLKPHRPPATVEEEPEAKHTILRSSLYAALVLACLAGVIFVWGPYLREVPRILMAQWPFYQGLVRHEIPAPGREGQADLAREKAVKIEPGEKEIIPLPPPKTAEVKPESKTAVVEPKPKTAAVEPESKTAGIEPELKSAPKAQTASPPAATVSVPPKASKPPGTFRPVLQKQKTGQEEKIARVQRGDSIYTLCEKFYGVANTTLVDYILEANSKIANPNFLRVNQRIIFPPITESSLVIESSSGAFQVHLGTFLKPEYTSFLNEEPSLQGKEIEMLPRPVSSGKTWYRVMVGPFKTREEGLEFVRTLRSKGLLPAFEGFRSHG